MSLSELWGGALNGKVSDHVNTDEELGLAEFRRLLKRAVFLPILGALFCCVLLLWQIQSLFSASAWVDRSDRLISEVYRLQKLMIDAETGARGFFSGEKRVFLEPYEHALRKIPTQFEEVRTLAANNAIELGELQEIETHWNGWLEWERGLVSMKARGQDIRPILQGLEEKKRMDFIRSEIDRLRSDIEELRNQHTAEMHVAHRMTLSAVIGMLLTFSFLVSFFTRRSFFSLSEAYDSSIGKVRAKSRDLLESREWFATSLSSIGDAVIAADLETTITFMNPEAEKLTGWTLAEARGRPMEQVFKIINQETRQPAISPVSRVLKEDVVVGLANHTVLIAKNGTEVPIEDSAAPIRNGRGVLGVILVFRDVSEKYAQRNELERLNEELREALKYRDEFLSVASHELKTPLTSLKMMLQISERQMRLQRSDTLAPATLGRLLTVFGEQITRLAKLVEDLLDVSRIRARRLSYRFERVDLCGLVKSQVERMAEEFKAVGSSIETRIPESVAVVADPLRLEQVIINLLSNAIKYGAGRPVLVSVERERSKAIIRVEDHGLGIAPEKQAAIFDRFERAVSSSNISGLGLGLYIAREILSFHKGTISVQSQLGKGSTFVVELPLEKSEESRYEANPDC